jgi:hypothetical protein
MPPLFGHKDDEDAGSAALQTEVDRIDSLSLPALATEVMTKGFGPGGPGSDPDYTVTVGGPNINAGATISAIATELAPGGSTDGADEVLRQRLYRLVAEGVQVLEHASLIRAQLHTAMGSLDYALTRLGRTALERGELDRILSGETPG